MTNTGGISTKHLRQNVNGVSLDFCRLQHKLWGSLKILKNLRALERKPIIQNEVFLSHHPSIAFAPKRTCPWTSPSHAHSFIHLVLWCITQRWVDEQDTILVSKKNKKFYLVEKIDDYIKKGNALSWVLPQISSRNILPLSQPILASTCNGGSGTDFWQ